MFNLQNSGPMSAGINDGGVVVGGRFGGSARSRL